MQNRPRSYRSVGNPPLKDGNSPERQDSVIPTAKENPEHKSSACECPDEEAPRKRQTHTGLSYNIQSFKSFTFFNVPKSEILQKHEVPPTVPCIFWSWSFCLKIFGRCVKNLFHCTIQKPQAKCSTITIKMSWKYIKEFSHQKWNKPFFSLYPITQRLANLQACVYLHNHNPNYHFMLNCLCIWYKVVKEQYSHTHTQKVFACTTEGAVNYMVFFIVCPEMKKAKWVSVRTATQLIHFCTHSWIIF